MGIDCYVCKYCREAYTMYGGEHLSCCEHFVCYDCVDENDELREPIFDMDLDKDRIDYLIQNRKCEYCIRKRKLMEILREINNQELTDLVLSVSL